MALALITFWCIVFWIDFPFPFYSFSLSFLGPFWLAGMALLLLSIHFACPFWAPSWLICYYFLFIFPVFFWLRAGWCVWLCYYFLFIFLVFFPLRAGWWVWLSHYFLFIFPFLFAARGWLPGAALLLLSVHFPCSSDSGSVSISFIFHLFFLDFNNFGHFLHFLVLILCWSLVLFWTKLGDFWCSFCAGLLCFFERNLAISGARFVLVSCAFLNETWRFLVLVLCWSLVLFWTILGDFWCSFCAGLLCFFERNLAISGARFVLVSCAFLNETWRFLVLVLCWSLVLFWTKLGDF